MTFIYVNPYLFEFLKEMFNYEVSLIFGRKVTEVRQRQYLSIAAKKPSGIKEIKELAIEFLNRKDTPDETSNFGRHICNKRKDFFIPIEQLNQLAESILMLGTFKDWNDFVLQYGTGDQFSSTSPSAAFEQFKYFNMQQMEEEEIYADLLGLVFTEVRDLIERKRMLGVFKGKPYRTLIIAKDYCYRFADAEDFIEIAALKQILNKQTEISNGEKLREISDNFYLVISNRFNKIVSQFCILPVSKSFFQFFLFGEKAAYDLVYSDIEVSVFPPYFLFSDLVSIDEFKGEIYLQEVIQNIIGLDKIWENSPFQRKSLMRKTDQQFFEKNQYSRYNFYYDSEDGFSYTRNTYIVSSNTIDYKPMLIKGIFDKLIHHPEVLILGLTF